MRKFVLLPILLLALSLMVPGVRASNIAVEREVFNFLTKELGFNSAAACGIMANIEAESDFRPTRWGDNGTSFGLCQWHRGRFDDLRAFCLQKGYDYTTVEGQLWFLQYELMTSYQTTYNILRKVPNTSQGAYDAAFTWCVRFERPAGMEISGAKRGRSAQMKYWVRYGDGFDAGSIMGNAYSGGMFSGGGDYTFYWDEEVGGDTTTIPGTTIQLPEGLGQESTGQPGNQSIKPQGKPSPYVYIPRHFPVKSIPQGVHCPWMWLFVSGYPLRRGRSPLGPMWQELSGVDPEELLPFPDYLEELGALGFGGLLPESGAQAVTAV